MRGGGHLRSRSRKPKGSEDDKGLQAAWLGLCYYYLTKADLTTTSTDTVACSLGTDQAELLRFEVSPPEAVDPLLRLVNSYADIAYEQCDVEAWRRSATVIAEALERFSELTLQQKVDHEVATVHSLAQSEEGRRFAEAVLHLLSQLAGEDGHYLPPSLHETGALLEPYLGRHFQRYGSEAILEAAGVFRWLASEARDEEVRLFVSAKCACGALSMASLLGELIELAIGIVSKREAATLDLVKKAVTNPVAEAVLELASAFRGLGGDTDKAVGIIWDAGAHPLVSRISWEQVGEPTVQDDRLLVNQEAQDAICRLLDTLPRYAATVTVADILRKGTSSWLLNSIKKATWNKRTDQRRKASRVPKEVPFSQIRKALPELAGLSDEELIGRLEVTRGKTYASDELDSAARRPAYPPEGCTPLTESEQASTRSSQIDQLEDALFLEGLAE